MHLFGHPDDPDVRISKLIARREQLEQVHFNEPLPEPSTCIDLLREYLAETLAIAPASFSMKMRYYPQLHAQQELMLDGGFGEIARRQFMNRLLQRGRDALRSGDAAAIRPFLQVSRASIFNTETEQAMWRGVEQQIEALWAEMPDPREMGLENFVDLLSIRTRRPNAYGFEQARLDARVLDYMPFAQPSFFRRVLRTPPGDRKNGRAFRRIIRTFAPPLRQYPLVKSGTTYPFGFPTLAAWGWTRMKNRFGDRFSDPSAPAFLDHVGPFVRDVAHSAAVRDLPLYDHNRITQTVERDYGGERSLAPRVDWWLAFEIWRRIMRF